MALNRVGHASVRLTDGRVLLIGGWSYSRGTGAPVADVELYDSRSGTFAATSPLNVARGGGHSATLLHDGSVLVAGGNDSLSSAELFDPVSGRWSFTGNMTRVRSGHSASLLGDGRVLITGGRAYEAPNYVTTSTAEVFDPRSRAFTALTTQMVIARFPSLGVPMRNGRVLLIGGNKSSAAAETFRITTLPVADAGPDRTVTRLTVVTLDGRASTVQEGGPLGYAWSVVSQPAGQSVTFTNATSSLTEFCPPVTGAYRVRLTVSSALGYSASHDVTVTVPNRQPGTVTVAAAGHRIAPGATVALTAACTDPDGDVLTFAWTVAAQPGGANVTLSPPNSATPSFSAATPGGYTLLCTVTDGRGGSASSSVSITVAEPGGTAFSVASSVPGTWGWVKRSAPLPVKRRGASMVYDSRRGRTVLFGGLDEGGHRLNDTWEWNGVSWTARPASSQPAGRYQHSMAYDEHRGRTVLLGGYTTGGAAADTWEWDGTFWQQLSPATSPQARAFHSLVYEAKRQRVLLFGGEVGGADAYGVGDTWAWNGTNWAELHPSTAPSARQQYAMAYDPVRNSVLLFGGHHLVLARDLDDTWEWNGDDWLRRSPTASPPKRANAAIGFELSTGRIVLFGGQSDDVASNETWLWDGNGWSQTSTPTSLTPRMRAAAAYDRTRGRFVISGGELPGGGFADNQTWEYDGTSWVQFSAPTTSPPPRARHGMAYDTSRKRAVVFGGDASGSYRNDTWEWTGFDWVQALPAASPSLRNGVGLAFNAASGVCVLFGGLNVSSDQNDTWRWNGTAWSQLTPSTPPPARRLPGMAYDSGRSSVLLFGGDSSGGELGDTWEFDGTAWRQCSPIHSPAARRNHAMSYDSERRRTVVFGGADGPGRYINDTWEWDGSDWVSMAPTTAPRARHNGAMTFDPVRRKSVLFGGWSRDEGGALSDTWQWDGATWRELGLGAVPSGRYGHGLCYDQTRKALLAFGGSNDTAWLSDTWELPSNRPPRVSATLSPAAPVPGDTVTLVATFADPDGDTPTWRWVQTYGPPVALTGAASAVASFTPTAAAFYGFEVVASDGHEGHAYALGDVTVNRAPSVSAGSDSVASVGTPVTLTATATDPDGDPLTYEWSQTSGPALSISPGNTARVITVTPGSAGVFTFRVAAADPWGGREVDSVALTATFQAQPDLVAVSIAATPAATEVNKPLTFTGVLRNAGTAAAGQFDVRFLLSRDTFAGGADPVLDGATVAGLAESATLTLTRAPVLPSSLTTGAYYAGMIVDPGNGVIESNEANNSATSVSTVRVDAPTVHLPNLIAVAVSGPSAALTGGRFDAAANVANRGNLAVDSPFDLSFLFSADSTLDPGDVVAGGVTVTSLAAGASADRFVSLTVPGALSPSTYRLLLQVDRLGRVTESSESDNVAASVLPVQVSNPPVIDTTAPTVVALSFSPGQTVLGAGTFIVTATFSEAVNRPEIRAASSTGRSLALAADPGSAPRAVWAFRASVTAADNGAYVLTLTTADAAGNPLTRQPDGNWFRIDVPINRPPTADAGPDSSVSTGTVVTLSGAGRDPDGDVLTYRWTSPAGITLIAPESVTPSFTANTPGRFTFTLTVTDTGAASASDAVEVVVIQRNPAVFTDLLQVRGLVRLASGETPQAGSRLQVANTSTGALQNGWLEPGSGAYRVEFSDNTGRAVATCGDLLSFTLFNPDGTTRGLRPRDHVLTAEEVLAGLLMVDLTCDGEASTGGLLVTIAGTGTPAFSGDSGPATSASINVPQVLVFDAAHNLYIADTGNARVRRITPGGLITTVAGNGKLEASGDEGQATLAGIGLPSGLAVSADGVLYIADRSNHRIRKVVLSSGVITTIAGTGVPGYSGDGGPPAAARLNQPRGLLLRGAGRLLVADSGNHRVRELELGAGGVIRTVAGNGLVGAPGDGLAATAASVVGPAGLATDHLGRLLIAEAGGHRIRRGALDGTIGTVAGLGRPGFSPDGTAPGDALLGAPVCVLGKANGDLVIAERDNNRIRLLELGAGRIRTLAGNGLRGFSADGTPAERAALGGPQGLELAAGPDGELVLSDSANNRVRKLVARSPVTADDHPNTAGGAVPPTPVTVDATDPTTGSLEQAGDVDFFSFVANPGRTYRLRTVLGTLGDTVLTLFDSDQVGVVAENDDAPGSRASLIERFRPRTAGTYYVRVKGFQTQAIGSYGLFVGSTVVSADPVVVTTGLPAATVGLPYGLVLEAAGGAAPYRWTLVSGALPPGLTLNQDSGLVSGTPPAAGEFRFAVTAKDDNGRDAGAVFILLVRPPGQTAFPESAHPYANNSDESAFFRLPEGPAAIRVVFDERTFVEAGFDKIHVTDGGGTPVSGSPFWGSDLAGRALWLRGDTVRVRLTSDGSNTGFGWKIVDVTAVEAASETLPVLPERLPGARRGEYYEVLLTAPAGVPGLTWSPGLVSALPPGLSLDTASGR